MPRPSRLPTEAEWEYACRAGTTTPWSGTDNEVALAGHAWFGANAGGTTHPVGQKIENAWGLCDMHGNVFEYCQDWFGNNYYSVSRMDDPTGPSQGSHRALRDGSWGDYAGRCRAAVRTATDPADRRADMGFRVARSLPDK